MARKKGKELQAIMKKYKSDRIFSWSRINSFINSPYEYFLKYILHIEEDRQDCIYATTGSISHDILESFYSKKINYDEMSDMFEDGWLTCGIAELKFDRNNEEKNEKISDKYYFDLKHFFKNHVAINKKVEIERFITIMLKGNLFQGYIDACFKDDDGNYVILDWKTSSIYKGKKAENECGQLLLYALGLQQMGVPLEKIKVCWNFLKYVSIEVEQANGAKKIRDIERFEIGSKIQSNAKMWLKKMGYTKEADDYLKLLENTNDIQCLPDDVSSKYKISDCYTYVDITQELIDKWTIIITNTIKDIEYREKEYEKSSNSVVFEESIEEVEKNSYYFATLCGYSANLHLPYKKYLEKLEAMKQEKDSISANISSVNEDKTVSAEIGADEYDLSWLNEI